MGNVKIGLEVHISLNKGIRTKMFCGCKLPAKPEPNTNCCPVCLAHPGAKPVFNRQVLKHALKLAIALNCGIAKQAIFSRKTYFYPDLPANYQITQYEFPLGTGGYVDLGNKKVSLKRVHMEEDPAALIHPGGVGNAAFTLIDYNRAGTPLIEVVTEPDIESAEDAREFLKKLLSIVEYLGIYDNSTGTMKADANISIRESGYTRVEIKNISGFKEIESALFHETERQMQAAGNNEMIIQETRGWDALLQKTYQMRKKEDEDDYGYIAEPNLTVIDITEEMIDEANKEVPELAQKKAKRLSDNYSISPEDANALAMDMELAELFEKAAKEIDPVFAARWLRKELVAVMKQSKRKIKAAKFDEKQLILLLKMLEKGGLTDVTARELLERLSKKSFDVEEYVKKHELEAVSDKGELRRLCSEAIEDNPKVADDFKAGKEEALNFLVGKVMKKTKGKAKAGETKEIIADLLKQGTEK
ncbi:MAG: Asp-tRNA(Asn)/Glu-tRNA(Gln) amidotransferase subunit GatB [Candidatus Nanoarchaeia archaeon]|nr:Asp-tRNA(Asn)/Glu-tRNA(Gln) amidotransferase subunit GatB [Candidatus Nanoarchaeia archaeon]